MIRTKLYIFVKALLILAAVQFCPILSQAIAADNTAIEPSERDQIKSIEAEEFQVRSIKSSKSGRVVLFEDVEKNRPATGKVLLIKSGKADILAVRVLKNYKGQFAGKIIHKFAELQSNTDYRAIKKIGDRVSDLISQREKRTRDPREAAKDAAMANEVLPDDQELDKGITPPVEDLALDAVTPIDKNKDKAPQPLFTKGGDELSGQDSLEISDDDESYYDPYSYEIQPLETLKHSVSIEYASMNSVDQKNNLTQYSAIGGRYAYVFGRSLIFNKRSLQDSISAEVSLFYYTISNFTKATDSVSILPLGGSFRYNILTGDYLMLYPYLGVLKNFITNTVDITDTGKLGAAQLMLGVGLQLKIGPSWCLRVDYGTDMTAFGVTLKF